MRQTWTFRLVASALLAASLCGVALASDPRLAVVRIESIDAVVRDVRQVAGRLGVEVSGQNLMQPLSRALGIQDLGWIDGSRPIVLVMPSTGMMLGAKGILGALPVVDPVQALSVLEELMGVAPTEQDGTLTFAKEDGNSLSVATRGGYVVVGSVPSLVAGFDPAAALSMSDMPAGSLSAEVFLEPLVPMATMGLQMGRQALEAEMAKREVHDAPPVEPEGLRHPHDHGDETPEHHGEEGGERHTEASTTQKLDPAALSGIFDLYFGFLQDVLNNTSRLQLSVEVGGSHVVLHKRLIPRAGSTLAGLIEAQKGGLPELARLIDPAGATAAVAGQLQMTPKFEEAIRGYLDRYLVAMRAMTPMLEQQGAAAPWLSRVFEMAASGDNLDRFMKCYRGDFAAGYRFGEGGFSVDQVYGAADPAACQDMVRTWGKLVESMPLGEGDKPLFQFTENALRYKGVSAARQVFEMPMSFDHLEGEAAEKARRAMSMWTGTGSMETYTGFAGQRVLTTTGSDAEKGFRALVDRASTKKPSGGITQQLFAPLAAGPGVFGMLDLVALIRAVPAEDLGATAEKLAFLQQVPSESARITGGARFDAGAVNIEVALPLGWLDAIGEAIDKQNAEKQTTEHEAGELHEQG